LHRSEVLILLKLNAVQSFI